MGIGIVELRALDDTIIRSYYISINAVPTATSSPTSTPTRAFHQADHTVQYVIGDMPPIGPSVSSSAPRVSGQPTPDPGIVVPASIHTAVTAWTEAVATPAPHVFFCRKTTLTNQSKFCEVRNTDSKSATIKIVPGVKTRAWNNDHNEHCGWSTACVKYKHSLDKNHYGDMTVIIEEPAYFYASWHSANQHVRIIWTDKPSEGVERIPDESKVWFYLPSIVMHELGHTAGLKDYYPPPYNGLMMNPYSVKTPSQDDISEMKKLYDGHRRH